MTSHRKSVAQRTRKLVVVGDGMAGKTCLLFAFKDDTFDPTHPPTIFDTYLAEVELDGKTVTKSNLLIPFREQFISFLVQSGIIRYCWSRSLCSSSSTVLF